MNHVAPDGPATEPTSTPDAVPPGDGPARAPRPAPSGIIRTVGWWIATLVLLIIVDDLTFGPVFWAISLFGSPLAGFLTAMAIYVPVQILLVREATSESPRRVAAFLLGRLDLQRRSHHIAEREQRLRSRVTGALSALALSMAIGGVLPPLILWRAGFSTRFVRNLSVATATIYALQFALLHGLAPGSI